MNLPCYYEYKKFMSFSFFINLTSPLIVLGKEKEQIHLPNILNRIVF